MLNSGGYSGGEKDAASMAISSKPGPCFGEAPGGGE